jgi:hypothetical protein
MNSFFSADMLMTYSGATLAVTLVTQFLKGIRWVDRLPTRVVSYFIALSIIIVSAFVRGGVRWHEIVLALVNAVVVALAANGAFDAVKKGN